MVPVQCRALLQTPSLAAAPSVIGRLSAVRRWIEAKWPVVVAASVFIGCQRQPDPPAQPPEPLGRMHASAASGNWPAAWAVTDEVLIRHPGDVSVMVQVASVARRSGHREAAVALLIEAAELADFADPAIIQAAVDELRSQARLIDAIEFLSRVVTAQPDQHASRRELFRLLVMIGDRHAARPHGRALVRGRQLDWELLTDLANHEKRNVNNDGLLQLVQRRPTDPRPLIGPITTAIERGDFQAAGQWLDQIAATHPNDLRAGLLRGRWIALTGQWDGILAWRAAVGAIDGATSQASYWRTVGDAAMAAGRLEEAAGAFAAAARFNPDGASLWAKYAATLTAATENDEIGVTGEQVNAVVDRAERLTRLQHHRDLFDRSRRSGGPIGPAVLDVAAELTELGRLWEAEAWMAMALIDPSVAGDPRLSEQLTRRRDQIVATLGRQTPWQSMREHPELAVNLPPLHGPASGDDEPVSDEPVSDEIADQWVGAQTALTPVTLVDEADRRGLRFFGRTLEGDKLNEPGGTDLRHLGLWGGGRRLRPRRLGRRGVGRRRWHPARS